MLFTDLPLTDRVARASALGFDGVECLFPYAVAPVDLAAALRAAGLPLALINTPEPLWSAGARGCAAIPGREAAFEAGFSEALAYGRIAGAERIHVLSGNTTDARARRTLVANLRRAAAEAPRMPLSIEPLNAVDNPGYWLDSYEKAAAVIDEAGLPQLSLQFDSWHAGRILGDPLQAWHRHAARVGHVQIAGAGARGAPDPGCPAGAALLRAIARDHAGWVAAEYLWRPGDAAGWLPGLRSALAGSHGTAQGGG